jgi:hypothetical protein
MVGVFAVTLGAVSPDAASAACLQQVAGAYLTTITSGPTVTSRSTILLNVQGTMSVVDSGQGTVGFTAAQGAWDCQVQHSQRELRATGLDFNTAGDTLFRTDYQATFDPQSETIAGTITLQSFPLLSDPLGSGGTVIGTFAFTGQRIPAGGN